MSDASIASMSQTFPAYQSLITVGLRHLAKYPEMGAPETGLRKRISDISVHEVLTFSDDEYAHVPSQAADLRAVSKARPTGARLLSIRQKWGLADRSQNPKPQPEPPHHSEYTIVHKAFGRFILPQEPTMLQKTFAVFPPLPNAAYNTTNEPIYRSGTTNFTPQLDGAAFVKEYMLEMAREDERQGERAEQASQSLGEATAKTIDWNRTLYDDDELATSAALGSIVDCRQDFVTDIDKASMAGIEPFSMCKKCNKSHIPWGPPLALQDLDPCLSMLPRWFPAEDFEHPWNAFIELINHTVKDAEKERGLIRDLDRVRWDKEYHEPSKEWRSAGRHGGWWKCRRGDEHTDVHIPQVERECKLCHRPKTQEKDLEARIQHNAKRKLAVQQWIEHCMAVEMRKDRAFVEARIRYERSSV